MRETFFDAEIVAVIQENPVVRRFKIKLVNQPIFNFTPGQFIQLKLPIQSKVPYRSYSIASNPNGTNVFELIISLKIDGTGTHFIWDHFVVGTKVEVSGPHGKFKLPPNINKELCFIATGAGIAPLRSMLLHVLENKLSDYPIYLISGNRTTSDILYHDEMKSLEKTYPQFHFIPVLSRENDLAWNGRKGYVHEVYEELYADKHNALFYICGWSDMIKEAEKRLQKMGYKKEEIVFERYD